MAGKHKVLFVDDDPEILASFQRAFRRKYQVDTALGPIRALEAVTERGPYAVVVSDLRMPALDGIELFTRLHRVCPDTVRVMLTGHADMDAAMDAVNAGHVFRFLIKPCAEEDLDEALAAAAALHVQAVTEKEFLKGALRGIIRVLTDLLSLLNPEAMARSLRIKRLVADMARYLEAPDPWRIDLAVTLSQLGGVVVPESLFAALRAGRPLEGDAARLFARHPALAADLLGNIPRLGEVAEIIRHQDTPFSGGAAGDPSGTAIPLGARLLKVTLDFDRLLVSGRSREEALSSMAGRAGDYDPALLEVLGILAGAREGYRRGAATVETLAPGMVLDEDVLLPGGEKAACAGQVADAALVGRLRALGACGGMPLRVLVPEAEEPFPGIADPELLALLRRVRSCPPGA